MKDDGFLRFALVMFDNNATNFYSSLSKLIQSVIFDNGPKTTKQLEEFLQENYGLTFSEKEIIESIRKDNKGIYNQEPFERGSKITLSEAARKRIASKKNDLKLKKIIERFTEHNEMDAEIKDIENILTRFLYYVFNSNTTELMNLISGKSKTFNKNTFDESEKRIVVKFLDWVDEDKDQFVFNLVNASFDYCSLSLNKKVPTQASDLFNGKKILLDTNVILSILGINGQSNKKSSQNFINKCNEQKITICYSNFTKSECERTISNLVLSLKQFVEFENDYLEDKEAGRSYNDINDLFCEWKIGNADGNYYDFEIYLISELNSLLYDYEFIVIDEKMTFSKSNIAKIAYSDLKSFKESRNRETNKPSLTHDVMNYLFMLDIKDNKSNSIFGQNYLFVTLDKLFSEWSKKKSNGLANNILMVDTIYSLLLRFSSRACDDFRAFNEFLKSSISYFYNEIQTIDIKNKIIRMINSINESNDLKKVIYLESERIIAERKTLGDAIDNPELIINSAFDNILSDYQKEAEERGMKYEERLKEAQSQLKSQNEMIENAILSKANARIRTKIIFLIIVSTLLISGVVAAVVFLISNRNDLSKVIDSVGFWITIADASSSILFFAVSLLLKAFNINFFNIGKDYNYQVCKIKMEKDMKKKGN